MDGFKPIKSTLGSFSFQILHNPYLYILSLQNTASDFVMLKRNDNLHLLELWINMLQKNLNTKNNINAKLFFEINK